MANKKKAMGVDPLSWIKQTKGETDKHNTQIQKEVGQQSVLPKYETYEVKLTLRLTESHLDFLSRMEREIMKNRSPVNKKERITKNSILRAMIDSFRDVDFNKKEIPDELELKQRFLRGLASFNITRF